MSSFGFSEMQAIQRELQARYSYKWPAIEPVQARNKLLWMMGEAGEMADVIKKQGDNAIMNDPAVRRHFVEEVCDTMMFLNDVLLCYGITPEEVEKIYREKHETNMKRW